MAFVTKIKEGVSTFKRLVNEAIANEMNRRIKKRRRKAEQTIKSLIPHWIQEQPEIQSILDQGTPGSLNAAFGLPPGVPEVSVSAIIETLTSSVNVLFKKVDRNLNGGIEFSMDPKLLVSLLRLEEGFVTTEKGQQLHWLGWLLTKGDELIISGYRYKPSDEQGRSGGGTMSKGGTFSIFRVNPEFSGSIENNFITRAFENRDRELSSILSDLLDD